MQTQQEIITEIQNNKDARQLTIDKYRLALKKLLKRGNNVKIIDFLDLCNYKWGDEYYLILKNTVLENPKMNALKVFSWYLVKHNGPINLRLQANRKSNFITHFLYTLCLSNTFKIQEKLTFYLNAMPLHEEDVGRVFNQIIQKNKASPTITTCFLQSSFKARIQEIIIETIKGNHKNICLLESGLEIIQLKAILDATSILFTEAPEKEKKQWIKLSTYCLSEMLEKNFLLNQLFFSQTGGKHDVLPAIKDNFLKLQYSVLKP